VLTAWTGDSFNLFRAMGVDYTQSIPYGRAVFLCSATKSPHTLLEIAGGTFWTESKLWKKMALVENVRRVNGKSGFDPPGHAISLYLTKLTSEVRWPILLAADFGGILIYGSTITAVYHSTS